MSTKIKKIYMSFILCDREPIKFDAMYIIYYALRFNALRYLIKKAADQIIVYSASSCGSSWVKMGNILLYEKH